jgi:hypothetical protein
VGKFNIDRKMFFHSSHNYCITDDRTVEVNIHLEDPVSTKTDVSFTIPTSTVGLQLLNL